jgi:hypothetical protein
MDYAKKTCLEMCPLLYDLKESSNPKLLFDIIERGFLYLQDATKLVQTSCQQGPVAGQMNGLAPESQEELCMYRWANDICIYLANNFEEVDDVSKCHLETQRCHGLWLKAKKKVTTNPNDGLSHLVLWCHKIQLMLHTIKFSSRRTYSEGSDPLGIEAMLKESLTLTEMSNVSMVSEWGALLTPPVTTANVRCPIVPNSRIHSLENALYWIEKGLEVVLMQLASDVDDERVLRHRMLSNAILMEQWSELQWIVDFSKVGLTYLTDLHREYVSANAGKKAINVAWLSATRELKELASLMDADTKGKAVTALQEAALAFGEEYKNVVGQQFDSVSG